MTKVFVIVESRYSREFECTFSDPIAVVTSLELAEAFLSRRHPLLKVEERWERSGSLDITLCGTDERYVRHSFEIRPVEMDPKNVQAVALPRKRRKRRKQRLDVRHSSFAQAAPTSASSTRFSA